MDLSEVKKQLSSLTNKKTNTPAKDYTKIYFKPTIGKQTIRVVPSKTNPDFPFSEMYFYYNIGKLNSIASLVNWGEKDPINEFIKELKKSNDKENWLLAKKLSAKVRYFVPVIVRGEEEKGVRLWQFGKQTYQDFLNLADDKEVGPYDDVMVGRDIKLTTVGPETTGTDYNKTSISPSLSTSPLSEDAAKVEEWLVNQPSTLEEYKKFTYEEIKDALRDHLSEDDGTGEEGEISSEKSEDFDDNSPVTNYTKTPHKLSTDEEFDALFEEKK